MPYFNGTNLVAGILAAFLILILLSGCERSGETLTAAPIPPLDPRTARPCYDPGVDPDAVKAITENRIALADCRRKHDNAVEAYNDVRATLGTEVGQ